MGKEKWVFVMSTNEIENLFPLLQKKGYKITSPSTIDYNCIAWAMNDNTKWWWPDLYDQYYWPPDISRESDLAAFINIYEKKGYKICKNKNHERGYEKVAIFTGIDNKPTHAARQISKDKWTSKLGNLEDISHHSLKDIEGKEYGKVAVILKRKITIKK